MTTGKGKDLAFLLGLAGGDSSLLMAIDIQKAALDQARAYMAEKNSQVEAIQWRLGSHEHVGQWLEEWPKASLGVSLVMYNLGYLPGSDKSITTMHDSTVASLEAVIPWIVPGGGISLMIYPGHETGHQESKELDKWLLKASSLEGWHFWQTRRLGADHAPYWVWMQKSL